MTSQAVANSPEDTSRVGEHLGSRLGGGEAIELAGDIGSGKTVFVRGLARGIGSQDSVMSPTFTISRIYTSDTLELHHFDFYRLDNPGIMAAELSESVERSGVAVVIEWSNIVENVLPRSRLRVTFTPVSESGRKLTFYANDPVHAELIKELV